VRGTSRAIVGADNLNVMHLAQKPARPVLSEVTDVVRVPHWLRIPLGGFIGVSAFLCGGFAVVLLLLPFVDHESDPGTLGALFVVGALLIGACAALFRISVRVWRGEDRGGWSATPRVLRIASLFFLTLALAVFYGAESHHKPSEMVAAFMYSGVFIILQLLAFRRKKTAHNQSPDPTLASVTPAAGQPPRLP